MEVSRTQKRGKAANEFGGVVADPALLAVDDHAVDKDAHRDIPLFRRAGTTTWGYSMMRK